MGPAPFAAAAASAASAATVAPPTSLLLAMDYYDNVNLYYSVIAAIGASYLIFNSVTGVVEEAKDYDRRGAMANQMAAEKKKRDRKVAREKVKKSEPFTYARMQKEKGEREEKRSGWKVFDAFKSPDEEMKEG